MSKTVSFKNLSLELISQELFSQNANSSCVEGYVSLSSGFLHVEIKDKFVKGEIFISSIKKGIDLKESFKDISIFKLELKPAIILDFSDQLIADSLLETIKIKTHNTWQLIEDSKKLEADIKALKGQIKKIIRLSIKASIPDEIIKYGGELDEKEHLLNNAKKELYRINELIKKLPFDLFK